MSTGIPAPKILIVDDERAILDLLRIAFAKAGYEVRTTTKPLEALGICTREAFDVVLSDVLMPALNGHDLAQWIAARSPNTRTVLMSGYDLECAVCPNAPRCELLPKPFSPGDAVSMVTRILRRA